MGKSCFCLAVFFGFFLLSDAQQVPIKTWKDLGAALDLLCRDTTLTDSSRLRVQSADKAFKVLWMKMKDSIESEKARRARDSASGARPADSGKASGRDVTIAPGRDSGTRRSHRDSGMKTRPAVTGVSENGGSVNWIWYGGLVLAAAAGLSGGWWLGRRKRIIVKEVREEIREVIVREKVSPAVIEQEVGGKGGFICEMMMTAGPRKKFMNEGNADKDLGEDVCGCVIQGDRVGLWLLDGTSDQFCLKHPVTGKEYFSSRLLAQGIGDRLREAFLAPGRDELDGMMAAAIEGVRVDWIKGFKELPEDERELLKENILGKNCPECASTLLMASLSADGDLLAYRSGDSMMLVFRNGGAGGSEPGDGEAGIDDSGSLSGRLIPSEASFSTKHSESNDRIFFRMVLDASGELDILCNKPGYELLREERVNTLIAFSDGIGAATAEALKQEYEINPGAVRQRIVTDSQGTADDKSICFIRIKEDS